jgi:hypothetical protein
VTVGFKIGRNEGNKRNRNEMYERLSARQEKNLLIDWERERRGDKEEKKEDKGQERKKEEAREKERKRKGIGPVIGGRETEAEKGREIGGKRERTGGVGRDSGWCILSFYLCLQSDNLWFHLFQWLPL